MSSNGLALVTTAQGLAVLKVSAPAHPLVSSPLLVDQMTPQAGDVESPSPVTFALTSGSSSADAAFFFGALPGKVLQIGQSMIGETTIAVQPPAASKPGAVDVSVRAGDGSAFYAPEGYSYGPVILFQDISAGPESGGTKVRLYGYGFGSGAMTVTVAGAGATITDLIPAQKISSYSFPIQQLEFLTPPGPIGRADITLTTANGTTTQKNGYLYVSHSRVSGLQPIQMVLDEQRGYLYIADAATGDVKAVDTKTLAVNTLIKMSAGAATGLALTPDRRKLLVISADAATLTVYELDARTVLKTLIPTPGGQRSVSSCTSCPPQNVYPTAVAATARGTALVGLAFANTLDTGKLYEVDLNSGAASDLGMSVGSVTWQTLFAPSADGGEIYIGNSGLYGTSGGYLSLWSAALGAVSWRRFTPGYLFYELSASASGDTVAADAFTFSRRWDELTVMTPIGPVTSTRDRVLGEKINASGSLIYMPTTKGVEVYDVHRGNLRLSVGIPGGVKPTLDGLVINLPGTTMYVAESDALGVIQLPAAPLSISGVRINGVVPGTRGGTIDTLTIEGSGFQKGATVRVGQAATYADVLSSTQMMITAPVPVTPRRHLESVPLFGITEKVTVEITNPDGDTYQLPAGYDPHPYLSEPKPVLSAISKPAPGTDYSQGISGSGFLVTSEVYIDGVSVHTVFVDSQHLVVYLYGLPFARHSVMVLNPHRGASNTITSSF